jgi:hypothetical protein
VSGGLMPSLISLEPNRKRREKEIVTLEIAAKKAVHSDLECDDLSSHVN